MHVYMWWNSSFQFTTLTAFSVMKVSRTQNTCLSHYTAYKNTPMLRLKKGSTFDRCHFHTKARQDRKFDAFSRGSSKSHICFCFWAPKSNCVFTLKAALTRESTPNFCSNSWVQFTFSPPHAKNTKTTFFGVFACESDEWEMHGTFRVQDRLYVEYMSSNF